MNLLLASLFKKFGSIFAAIISGLAVVASIFYAGKKSSEAESAELIAKAKNDASNQKAKAKASAKETETLQKVNDVKSNIDGLDAESVANELRNKWTRKQN